jgi:hypothetical protein
MQTTSIPGSKKRLQVLICQGGYKLWAVVVGARILIEEDLTGDALTLLNIISILSYGALA